MQIVHAMLWQNWGRQRSVKDFVEDEMYLAELAEDLGYDAVSCVEHHFDLEYSACPDNFVALANLAARTSTISLITGASILPWNDPLRVTEKFALLDHLSGGRLKVGFGRGLARVEYEGFGIAMDESRERFDEAAEVVLRGLRTGKVSGTGTFYQQPEVEIHPEPRASLADDFLCVAMSEDSATAAGDMGANLLAFTTKSPEGMRPLIEGYRGRYRASTGLEAPPEQLHDFLYPSASADEVATKGALHVGRYYQEVVRHYDFAGKHFADTKGYQSYAKGAAEIRAEGMDAATKKFVDAQMLVGTPDQIVSRFEERLAVLGRTDLGVPSLYGGLTRAETAANMTLFAREILPELRRLDAAHASQPVSA
jgi:alkanesulfonate monooxygenase SsuD/methylene tetrahydromethanopterin reductase-like flavin-dependent oxidoreductase (luciferase family)